METAYAAERQGQGRMEILHERTEQSERVEIADRLKKIRVAKGVTQKTMAEEMGLADITYVKLENASHNITTKNLKKISRILGVPTDLILFGNTGTAYSLEDFIKIKYSQFINASELESIKMFLELLQKLQILAQSPSPERYHG